LVGQLDYIQSQPIACGVKTLASQTEDFASIGLMALSKFECFFDGPNLCGTPSKIKSSSFSFGLPLGALALCFVLFVPMVSRIRSQKKVIGVYATRVITFVQNLLEVGNFPIRRRPRKSTWLPSPALHVGKAARRIAVNRIVPAPIRRALPHSFPKIFFA
jgi:hypothetical protein